MFGKAKCKLCGDEVRFALRHLKQKHTELLSDKEYDRTALSTKIKDYFSD
jgi:hypothetical protein